MKSKILLSMRFYGETTEENYLEFEKVIRAAVENFQLPYTVAEDILAKAKEILEEDNA